MILVCSLNHARPIIQGGHVAAVISISSDIEDAPPMITLKARGVPHIVLQFTDTEIDHPLHHYYAVRPKREDVEKILLFGRMNGAQTQARTPFLIHCWWRGHRRLHRL